MQMYRCESSVTTSVERVQLAHGGRLVYITSRRHAQSTPSVSKGVANVPAQSSSPKVKKFVALVRAWCLIHTGSALSEAARAHTQRRVRAINIPYDLWDLSLFRLPGLAPSPFQCFLTPDRPACAMARHVAFKPQPHIPPATVAWRGHPRPLASARASPQQQLALQLPPTNSDQRTWPERARAASAARGRQGTWRCQACRRFAVL